MASKSIAIESAPPETARLTCVSAEGKLVRESRSWTKAVATPSVSGWSLLRSGGIYFLRRPG